MKLAFSLLLGISFVMTFANGSSLQAQSIPMSLTTPGTNNVMTITVRADTSLLGSSSDSKPFNMTGGYTVYLDSTYDANSRAPTLNNLAFNLDNPGNILMNNTGGNFHLKWLFGAVNEYASATTLNGTPMSPNGPNPLQAKPPST